MPKITIGGVTRVNPAPSLADGRSSVERRLVWDCRTEVGRVSALKPDKQTILRVNTTEESGKEQF